MVAVGFPDLPLHTVAVNGMMEAFLSYAYQQLYRSIVLLAISLCINCSQRKDCHGMAIATIEERLYQFLADHALPFGKARCYALLLIHLNIIYRTLILHHEQIVLQSTRHRGILLRRSLQVQPQPCLLGSLCRGGAKGGNGYLVLLEVWEILGQRLYA